MPGKIAATLTVISLLVLKKIGILLAVPLIRLGNLFRKKRKVDLSKPNLPK